MKWERLIPLPEYAKREGISESLARKWLKEGRLEAVRLGHYWYVPEWVEVPEGRVETYTLFTHAGGAGKTSLARDVGFEVASRGYKVLLVDGGFGDLRADDRPIGPASGVADARQRPPHEACA